MCWFAGWGGQGGWGGYNSQGGQGGGSQQWKGYGAQQGYQQGYGQGYPNQYGNQQYANWNYYNQYAQGWNPQQVRIQSKIRYCLLLALHILVCTSGLYFLCSGNDLGIIINAIKKVSSQFYNSLQFNYVLFQFEFLLF